jgi:hypothetical protein
MGNIGFASPHSLKNRKLSRRDDIISLAYLLIYCLTGEIPNSKDEKGNCLNACQLIKLRLESTPE